MTAARQCATSTAVPRRTQIRRMPALPPAGSNGDHILTPESTSSISRADVLAEMRDLAAVSAAAAAAAAAAQPSPPLPSLLGVL